MNLNFPLEMVVDRLARYGIPKEQARTIADSLVGEAIAREITKIEAQANRRLGTAVEAVYPTMEPFQGVHIR